MAKKKKKTGLGLNVTPVFGDSLATCLWVLISSLIGEAAEKISRLDALQPLGSSHEYAVGIVLTLVVLFFFTPLCNFLWGAIFNPANNFALWFSGKGKALENVLRMAGQVAGALAGSFIATTIVPHHYQGKFQNLSGRLVSGTQLEIGFACEVLLSLASNLLFLLSLDARSSIVAFWMPLLATAGWCYLGSFFTGPSMNPAQAFSWNWHYQQHTLHEHLVVFWLGPFVGAALAGIAYLWLKPTTTTKKKQRSAAPTTEVAKPAAVKAPAAAAASAATLRKRAGKATAAANGSKEPEADVAKQAPEAPPAPAPAAAAKKKKKASKVAAPEVVPASLAAAAAAVAAAEAKDAPPEKAKRKKANAMVVEENGWVTVPVRAKGKR